MAQRKKDRLRAKRRTLRVRSKFKHTTLPRASVFRSLKHIYAQIIDDSAHRTLTSFSSLQLEKPTGDKKAIAREVGRALAQQAKKQGIEKVLLDRGTHRYHGRVQALAEGLREGGLQV